MPKISGLGTKTPAELLSAVQATGVNFKLPFTATNFLTQKNPLSNFAASKIRNSKGTQQVIGKKI